MNINPIKTKRDYNDALARIEDLMEAEFNTPEGDELDVLTTLVENYEEKALPIKFKEKNEKRYKKERARKTLGHECTGSNRTIGIWEAVYKKGSMPKT